MTLAASYCCSHISYRAESINIRIYQQHRDHQHRDHDQAADEEEHERIKRQDIHLSCFLSDKRALDIFSSVFTTSSSSSVPLCRPPCLPFFSVVPPPTLLAIAMCVGPKSSHSALPNPYHPQYPPLLLLTALRPQSQERQRHRHVRPRSRPRKVTFKTCPDFKKVRTTQNVRRRRRVTLTTWCVTATAVAVGGVGVRWRVSVV